MSRKKTKKQGQSKAEGKAFGKGEQNAAGQAAAPVIVFSPLLSPKINLVLWLAGLVSVACFYLVLKSFSIHPYAGDEFIYLFQGKLISEGARPYADFAMAHPPLQALSAAVIFKIFGVHFTMMRLFPILWCLAGGIGLAVMVRRELGSMASVVSAALFLTAYETLRAASHFTGVNMTVALMIFATVAYRKEWIRTAAIFAVCAVFTRLYAIPGVLALVLFAVISDRNKGLRLILYGGMFSAPAFVLLGLWTGFGDMANNIFLYHAEKTSMSEQELAGMRDSVLFHNATLASLFALSLLLMLAVLVHSYNRTDFKQGIAFRLRAAIMSARLGLPLFGAFTALVFLVLLLHMNRVWMYYFIPAFPFAAITSSWMISQIATGAVRLARAKGRPASAGLSNAAVVGGAAATALFIVLYIFAPRLEERLSYYGQSTEESSDERTHRYTFLPSALPEPVNNLVQSLFWKDERIIGEPYNAFNYYLWHESRVLDITDKVVDIIQRETSPRGEIFGDSGTVPLFALLSGRGIAGNVVDTNIQRYRSGNADPKELISKIDNYKTEMIILRRRFGVYGVPEVLRLVETKYRRLTEIRSAQGWVFQIYKRKTDPAELKES